MIRNLSIRLKMVTMYIIMTVFTLPLLFIMLWGGSQLSKGQNAISASMLAGTEQTLKMQALLQQQLNTREALSHTENPEMLAATLDSLEAKKTKFDEHFSAYQQTLLPDDAEAQGLYNTLQTEYYKEYLPLLDAYTSALKQGDNQAAATHATQLQSKLETILPTLDAVVAHGNAHALAVVAKGERMMQLLAVFLPGYVVVYVLSTLALGRKLAKVMAFPLQDLGQAAGRIAKGDVEVEVLYESKDEIGMLAQKFRDMLVAIKQQASTLSIIAQGDYTGSIQIRSDEDVVNRSITNILDNSNSMVSNIRSASDQVAAGAAQIAQASQSLAVGTTQQAASIQEFSASINMVQDKTQSNSAAAKQALEVSQQASPRMHESMRSMGGVIEAMHSIDESSRNITKVIKVIEDIAFQTNILALNAAVEAARAGQHGKGFAVVADEVRNLAGKSAAAAKESTALIEGSIGRVEEGNRIVEKASEDMREVSSLSEQSYTLTQGIAADSEEQALSIQEISHGIEQISQIIQANSASSEESAASAQEMSAQAAALKSAVERFRLREENAVPTLPMYNDI